MMTLTLEDDLAKRISKKYLISPWKKQEVKLWNWLIFDLVIMGVIAGSVCGAYFLGIRYDPFELGTGFGVFIGIIIIIFLIIAVMTAGVFFSFNFTSLVGVLRYREIMKLKEENDVETIKATIDRRVKSSRYSDPSIAVDFLMNNTYNEKECAIAALSEMTSIKIDRILIDYLLEDERVKIKEWVKGALGYRSKKVGFETIKAYIEFLDENI